MKFVNKKELNVLSFKDLKIGEVFTLHAGDNTYYMKIKPINTHMYYDYAPPTNNPPIITPSPIIAPDPITNPSITWTTTTMSIDSQSQENSQKSQAKNVEVGENTTGFIKDCDITTPNSIPNSILGTIPYIYEGTQYVAINLNNGKPVDVNILKDNTTVYRIDGKFVVD